MPLGQEPTETEIEGKVDSATKSEPLTCSIGSVPSREYERGARGLNHLSYLIKILRTSVKTPIFERKSEFSEISDPAYIPFNGGLDGALP